MKIIHRFPESTLETIKKDVTYPVLTIGNFDGLHLGHQAIIRSVVKEAKIKNGIGIVITFEPHPFKILAPDSPLMLLTPFDERMGLIEELGIDLVICAKFDEKFAHLSPYEFAANILYKEIAPKEIYVGQGFVFGHKRSGSIEDLKRFGKEFGFKVYTVAPVMLDGERVSSSRIRRLLGDGKVKEAARLLGRYYSIEGAVVAGKDRGKDLGYPTANILPPDGMIPKDGVYATRITLDKTSMDGVTYIGNQPTFGISEKMIEAHIFNYKNNLYNKKLRIAFIEHIRDDMTFDNQEALVKQIEDDIRRTKDLLVYDKCQITKSKCQI